MNRRLGWRIERLILLALILLAVLDFATLLPVFWKYVLDIISWTSVAYLVYVVSPTELFFGERHAYCDLGIVIAFVAMSVKDLIGNAAAALVGLVQTAGSYISFSPSSATTGVPFSATAADLNSYETLHLLPHKEELARAVAPHLHASAQQLNIILTDGTRQVALTATPTGLDGTMLLFYNTLVKNAAMIETAALVSGVLLLLLISVYASYRIGVRKPSILSVLKEEGPATLMRPVWVLLLLAGFFVIVFNLLFEWLTLTAGMPLLLLTVLALLTVFLIRRGFSTDDLLEDLRNVTNDFLTKAIRLFMDAKTILLGVSGFLVLHLITDLGSFIAPAVFAWYKTAYLLHTPGIHDPLSVMMSASLTGTPAQNALLVLAYAASLIGIVLLLCLPAVIWYSIFRIRTTGSHEHLPDWKGWQVGLALACMAFFLLVPLFSISSIRTGEVVGVNLTSNPITLDRLPMVVAALAIGGVIFVVCAFLGAVHDHVRRVLMLGPILVALVFFGVYIYDYFTSIFAYYAQTLVLLVQAGTLSALSVLPVLFVLFGFTIFFFITGYFSFLYEIWRD